jgi:hypothetical protein
MNRNGQQGFDPTQGTLVPALLRSLLLLAA